MEVGAVSAVIEEFNVCMDAVKGLVGGYYRRLARKRSLRNELDRALERVKKSAAAAVRLDRLLVLEMAPAHFRVLQSAVAELQRRTAHVVLEAERYAASEPEVEAARESLDRLVRNRVEGRSSVESATSVAIAALVEVDPPAPAAEERQTPPLVPEKGMLANLASQSKRIISRPLSLRPGRTPGGAAVQPAPGTHAVQAGPSTSAATERDAAGVGCFSAVGRSAGDPERGDAAVAAERGSVVSTAAAACWGRTRSVAGCVGGVVFSEISDAQRRLLHEALEALEEACRAIEAAQRQVRVTRRRPKHYVRPPIFRRIVEALYEDPTPIVVISGAPALGKSALAQEIKWMVDSQVRARLPVLQRDTHAWSLCSF